MDCRLREVSAPAREVHRLGVVLLLRRDDRLLKGPARLREVRPHPLPGREEELAFLDNLHRPFVRRSLDLRAGLHQEVPRPAEAPFLDRVAGGIEDSAGRLDRGAACLRLGNRFRHLPEDVLDAPDLGHDPLDLGFRRLREVDRAREVPLLERLPRVLEEVHGGREVRAEVSCGDELVAALGNRDEDALELCLLQRLVPLACERRTLLEAVFLDRSLRLLEDFVGPRRVRPDPLRLVEPRRKICDAALKPLLEGPLALLAALLEGVDRLLELQLRHVVAAALDELRHLRHVGPRVERSLLEILRIADRSLDLVSEVSRDGVKAFLQERERHLEVVRLYGLAGPGEEVLDGSRVLPDFFRGEDEGLRLRERLGEMLVKNLLAPLPDLRREVHGGLELVRLEVAAGTGEACLALRNVGAEALRHRDEVRARLDDPADSVPVDPRGLLPRGHGFIERELVVLRSRVGGCFREEDIRLRCGGVDFLGAVD